eukprot:9487984-Pyramimonas_sp.AAC.1
MRVRKRRTDEDNHPPPPSPIPPPAGEQPAGRVHELPDQDPGQQGAVHLAGAPEQSGAAEIAAAAGAHDEMVVFDRCLLNVDGADDIGFEQLRWSSPPLPLPGQLPSSSDVSELLPKFKPPDHDLSVEELAWATPWSVLWNQAQRSRGSPHMSEAICFGEYTVGNMLYICADKAHSVGTMIMARADDDGFISLVLPLHILSTLEMFARYRAGVLETGSLDYMIVEVIWHAPRPIDADDWMPQLGWSSGVP